ncbi:MFS transporter [Geothrix rubra]|uniref:MFS transporter n=1 Tax=Geothrix rubra TaxID=2927977 RepID=A0ABQ5Q255_9BACT|nr:MFS transporter [Geothrix rubra]GLH68491.1 MFS transporter [Geothrix rubra]
MDPRDQSGEEVGWRYALRALKFRNYRLFFGGQSLSLIGTWMTRIAMSWLVYRLTGSAFLLGLTGFASQIPTFVLGPFAGVWVDRLDRHRVLVVTQVLSMLQSFALAALALPHHITVAEILWLSVFQGVVNAFDMPARQAFLHQMVERREDLPNAIALNSSMVNGSRLIGPSLAGLVIAGFGEGWCFLIDGASYMAVIASLLLMEVRVPQVRRAAESVGTELREGWRYVAGFPPVRNILLLLALVSFVGMPYTVLMPIFATRVLGGGAHTLGFLMGASGLGALASAAWLASRKSVRGLLRVIPTVAAIFGAGIIAFGFSRWLPLSLALLLFTGFGMMQQMAASNTILQTVTDEDKRGRVMSYYAMAFQGTMPFGSLIAGWAADRIGAPATLAIGGGLCLAGAAWFLSRMGEVRRALRPVYTRLGIIPPPSQ